MMDNDQKDQKDRKDQMEQNEQKDKSSAFIVVNGVDDRDAGIYSDNFYSQRMSPMRSAIRRRLLPLVRSETGRLAALQVNTKSHSYQLDSPPTVQRA